jgi:ABC-type branched-subunit amino acid transport system substrate-binding protein
MIARFAVFVALLALASAGAAPAPADAQSGPIKIGLLVPLTGAASALGKDMLSGTELYLDEINRQVAGRKIELIVEDTEGVTATALTKARKLVDQNHVAILTAGSWPRRAMPSIPLPTPRRSRPRIPSCPPTI